MTRTDVDEIYLYTAPLIAINARHGFDAQRWIEGSGMQASTFWYPDRSLEIHGAQNIEPFEIAGGGTFWQVADDEAVAMSQKLTVDQVCYDSLRDFSDAFYIVLTYGDWILQLPDRAMFITTQRRAEFGMGISPEACEPPLDRCLVTVEFKKVLRHADFDRLNAILKHYAESVQSSGIGGEGPISGLTAFTAAKRAIQFRFNASQTGQRTINWLLLSLFEICPTNPITEVYFTSRILESKGFPPRPTDRSFEEVYGPFDRQVKIQ